MISNAYGHNQLRTLLMTISVGVSNGSAAASVPSDSRIDFCLAQIPTGETSPLSARSRSCQMEKNWVLACYPTPQLLRCRRGADRS